jgi:hypothetical protein
MDWLTGTRVRAYLRILASVQLLMLVLLVVTSRGGIDRGGHLLGSDFISFWAAGQMLRAGEHVYDAFDHIAAQRAFFAPPDGYTAFFYPPTFLPFCWPLGLLGYFPALAAWLAVTGGVYLAAARAWLREAGIGQPLWLLFLAFPAVSIVITHGQTAFLVAALLGGGVFFVRSRPVLAGVLFGLATIKPQFGLLLPVALLASREWRTIAAACLAALALALLSSFAFGPMVWPDWLAASARAQQAMASGAVGYAKMVSAYAALRLVGVPDALAYAAQGAVTLAVAALVLLAALHRRFTRGTGALVLAGAPLATPFVLDYDLVLIAFPMIWLAGEGLRGGFRRYEKMALTLAFAAPALGRPLAMNLGLPLMPFVLGLLFWTLWRRVSRSAPDHVPA